MKTTIVVGGLMALALSRPGEALAQTSVARADQSNIRFVSAFVAPGRPVPGECRAEAHIFAESLVRYPGPNSWHWVLVCDEASWQRFLRLSGREGRDDIYASTDLEARTTYLSGAKLLY